MLWEDGHRNDFDVRDLRLACRCALCVEEMSGHSLLDPKSVRPDVTPRTITAVGNMPSPSTGTTATAPRSTRSSTCGLLVSAAPLGSSKMSDLLVDSTITIRAETLLADPDAFKFTVSRTVHPGGPFFFSRLRRRRAGSSDAPPCAFSAMHSFLESLRNTRGRGRPGNPHRTFGRLWRADTLSCELAGHGTRVVLPRSLR